MCWHIMPSSAIAYSGRMKAKRISNQITAKQVYEVWSSEPELIRILDLREHSAFTANRIPGSRWVAGLAEIRELATDAHDILFVIVTEKGAPVIIDLLEQTLNNVVALTGGIEEWRAQGLPLCPQNQPPARSSKDASMNKDILFYKLVGKETPTFTYLLADRETREAILIDPVLETVDRDLKLIQEHGLRLLYVLDTRVHADHLTSAGELRKRTGAKTGVSARAQVACADLALEEGQVIRFGHHSLRVLEIPGRTNGCLSFYCDTRVFTGDALLTEQDQLMEKAQ